MLTYSTSLLTNIPPWTRQRITRIRTYSYHSRRYELGQPSFILKPKPPPIRCPRYFPRLDSLGARWELLPSPAVQRPFRDVFRVHRSRPRLAASWHPGRTVDFRYRTDAEVHRVCGQRRVRAREVRLTRRQKQLITSQQSRGTEGERKHTIFGLNYAAGKHMRAEETHGNTQWCVT